MSTTARFNLRAIDRTLHRLQKTCPKINRQLRSAHGRFHDEQRRAMLEGYRFVERESSTVDWLAHGNSDRLLELNHVVLFGEDAAQRRAHRLAIQHNERRYYADVESGLQPGSGQGIGHLIEWVNARRRWSPWRLAAGAYIQVLSSPELFVEGNHRTASLLIAHILYRSGLPPFVLTPSLAGEWLACTPAIQSLNRTGMNSLLKERPLQRKLSALLEHHADSRYLLAPCQSSRMETCP